MYLMNPFLQQVKFLLSVSAAKLSDHPLRGINTLTSLVLGEIQTLISPYQLFSAGLGLLQIILMLKHSLPYLFYSVNCGLFLNFLHPNRFCTLLDSIINKCMHLKVFVNYCTLITFWCRDHFFQVLMSLLYFVGKPSCCLRNVHYYMINLMTSHLMMVYM